jgi:hypothetical protein
LPLTGLETRSKQSMSSRCCDTRVVDARKMLVRAAPGHHPTCARMLSVRGGVMRSHRLSRQSATDGLHASTSGHATCAVRRWHRGRIKRVYLVHGYEGNGINVLLPPIFYTPRPLTNPSPTPHQPLTAPRSPLIHIASNDFISCFNKARTFELDKDLIYLLAERGSRHNR